MISKEAFEKFPLYHEYTPGTYKDLSYEERKYYIDLIRNSPHKSTTDFYDFSGDYDISSNLCDFLSDFSLHLESIERRINDDIRPLYNDRLWLHLADDFSNDDFCQHISWAEFYNDDKLSVNMEYDQSSEDIEVDWKLISDDYVNSKIKEYFNKIYDGNVKEIEYCKNKINMLLSNNIKIKDLLENE